MDNPTDNLIPMGIQSKETMDLAAAKAREAVADTEAAAHHALGQVEDTVDGAMAGASEAIHNARLDVSRRVAEYTAAEPVKAILIAAATGAALMALLAMMVRSGD